MISSSDKFLTNSTLPYQKSMDAIFLSSLSHHRDAYGVMAAHLSYTRTHGCFTWHAYYACRSIWKEYKIKQNTIFLDSGEKRKHLYKRKENANKNSVQSSSCGSSCSCSTIIIDSNSVVLVLVGYTYCLGEQIFQEILPHMKSNKKTLYA